MADPVIRLRATDETAAAFTSAASNVERLSQQSARLATDMKAIGPSVGQVNAALRTLPAQFTDIATQLAGGQSPFLILLQQGGQIKDSFGGIGPAISNIGKLITPTRVAIGGVVGVVAALGVALYQGAKQADAFNHAVLLSGNAAGTTAAQYEKLVLAVSAANKVTVGAAREAAAAALASGQVGPQVFAAFTNAVAAFADKSGQSADEVTKDFLRMNDGVAKFAADRNKSLNFLTVEQYKYIQSLEASGDRQKAQLVVLDALNERFGKSLPASLGYLGSRLQELTGWWSNFWNSVNNIGKPDNVEQQIARIQNILAGFDRDRANLGGKGPENPRAAALREELKQLQATAVVAAQAGAEQARVAAETNKKIETLGADHVAAQQRLTTAQFEAEASIASEARAREEIAVKRSYDLRELNGQGYVQAMTFLAQEEINSNTKVLNAQIALEQKRAPTTPIEVLDKQARLLELNARRAKIQTEQAILEEKKRTGAFAAPERGVVEDAQTTFRLQELAQTREVEKGVADRVTATLAGTATLRQQSKDLAIGLVKDTRDRAQLQLNAELEARRKELDIGNLSGKAREDAEADFADYTLLRQQQLNEELKPEYLKLLEYWQDTTRLMKDAYNDFSLGFVQTGQDIFVEFAKTGKLNVKSLVDFTIAELAKLQYQKFLASSVAKGGDFLAGLLGFKSSGSSGSSLSNAPTDEGLLSQFGGSDGAITPSRYLDPSAARGASTLSVGKGDTNINVAAGVQRNELVSTVQTMRKAILGDVNAILKSKGVA